MPSVRFWFSRSQAARELMYEDGETYADLLLRCGVVPDTVLILAPGGRSLPEDAPVCEEEVTIDETASRG